MSDYSVIDPSSGGGSDELEESEGRSSPFVLLRKGNAGGGLGRRSPLGAHDDEADAHGRASGAFDGETERADRILHSVPLSPTNWPDPRFAGSSGVPVAPVDVNQWARGSSGGGAPAATFAASGLLQPGAGSLGADPFGAAGLLPEEDLPLDEEDEGPDAGLMGFLSALDDSTLRNIPPALLQRLQQLEEERDELAGRLLASDAELSHLRQNYSQLTTQHASNQSWLNQLLAQQMETLERRQRRQRRLASGAGGSAAVSQRHLRSGVLGEELTGDLDFTEELDFVDGIASGASARSVARVSRAHPHVAVAGAALGPGQAAQGLAPAAAAAAAAAVAPAQPAVEVVVEADGSGGGAAGTGAASQELGARSVGTPSQPAAGASAQQAEDVEAEPEPAAVRPERGEQQAVEASPQQQEAGPDRGGPAPGPAEEGSAISSSPQPAAPEPEPQRSDTEPAESQPAVPEPQPQASEPEQPATASSPHEPPDEAEGRCPSPPEADSESEAADAGPSASRQAAEATTGTTAKAEDYPATEPRSRAKAGPPEAASSSSAARSSRTASAARAGSAAQGSRPGGGGGGGFPMGLLLGLLVLALAVGAGYLGMGGKAGQARPPRLHPDVSRGAAEDVGLSKPPGSQPVPEPVLQGAGCGEGAGEAGSCTSNQAAEAASGDGAEHGDNASVTSATAVDVPQLPVAEAEREDTALEAMQEVSPGGAQAHGAEAPAAEEAADGAEDASPTAAAADEAPSGSPEGPPAPAAEAIVPTPAEQPRSAEAAAGHASTVEVPTAAAAAQPSDSSDAQPAGGIAAGQYWCSAPAEAETPVEAAKPPAEDTAGAGCATVAHQTRDVDGRTAVVPSEAWGLLVGGPPPLQQPECAAVHELLAALSYTDTGNETSPKRDGHKGRSASKRTSTRCSGSGPGEGADDPECLGAEAGGATTPFKPRSVSVRRAMDSLEKRWRHLTHSMHSLAGRLKEEERKRKRYRQRDDDEDEDDDEDGDDGEKAAATKAVAKWALAQWLPAIQPLVRSVADDDELPESLNSAHKVLLQAARACNASGHLVANLTQPTLEQLQHALSDMAAVVTVHVDGVYDGGAAAVEARLTDAAHCLAWVADRAEAEAQRAECRQRCTPRARLALALRSLGVPKDLIESALKASAGASSSELFDAEAWLAKSQHVREWLSAALATDGRAAKAWQPLLQAVATAAASAGRVAGVAADTAGRVAGVAAAEAGKAAGAAALEAGRVARAAASAAMGAAGSGDWRKVRDDMVAAARRLWSEQSEAGGAVERGRAALAALPDWMTEAAMAAARKAYQVQGAALRCDCGAAGGGATTANGTVGPACARSLESLTRGAAAAAADARVESAERRKRERGHDGDCQRSKDGKGGDCEDEAASAELPPLRGLAGAVRRFGADVANLAGSVAAVRQRLHEAAVGLVAYRRRQTDAA
ncbi:hypothetical protein HYH03_000188 [Edaphochlamys debaryana]|uniref:Uncharacterized protein n=1 Tax=Edaphochlamys debaryana TaxID=47281 RepID=A0A836C5X6_9CHLO|nr:hypothetical protein HYH03_000188 [Edaphochlamys debaryana]|eukprot:KAG2501686.1 hypothetical protein HYH03_000188 [Edaphochlamys debaryana]